MKKAKKTAVIIAVCFLGAGLLVMLAGFAINRFQFPGIQIIDAKTETISEDFESIVIDCETDYLSIVDYDGDECTISYDVNKYYGYEVEVIDKTLTITMCDNRRWFEKWANIGGISIRIRLPRGDYKDLIIINRSGDVGVSGKNTFENVSIDNKSGDIIYFSKVNNALEIKGVSGDITLGAMDDKFKISPKILTIATTSGDIVVDDIDGDTDLTIASTCGDINLAWSNCKSAAVSLASGDVMLSHFIVSDALKISTASGDVKFKDSDAGSIEVSVKN